ncbi:MAG: hypothetical protein OXG56_11445 [Gammaproteobacteria bacterium]|nr:hypothetical protein [Gammaproteobacteria bacterium]
MNECINLGKYPFYGADESLEDEFIADCRQVYRRTGICELPEFILPSALDILAGEASQWMDSAYFCDNSHNAYLDTPDCPKGPGSVEHTMERTVVGSIPYDRIDPGSLLNQIYLWDPLKDFIGRVLGKSPFYRFSDPMGACSINVFVEGGEHGWHFDESEYSVTLMLQSPEQGGEFEYVPRIRGMENEQSMVGSVLHGNRSGVENLPFVPGTLLIFGGKQTLHRVTRVSGPTPRLVPVLCFAEEPGRVNSEKVRKLFWGRAT